MPPRPEAPVPAAPHGGTEDHRPRDAQLHLFSPQSTIGPPEFDIQTLQNCLPPSPANWWEDASLNTYDYTGGISSFGWNYGLGNGPHDPNSWALSANQFHQHGSYHSYSQEESQAALSPYLATPAHQAKPNLGQIAENAAYDHVSTTADDAVLGTAHGRLTQVNYSASVMEPLPATGHVPQVMQRFLSEPELDEIVASVNSNGALANSDGSMVLLSPPTTNSSPDSSDVVETSSTVQRLAAMVKAQQKTIELLLQEVTKRPRRKPKNAETRHPSTARDAQASLGMTPSTSGAVAKTQKKRSALGQTARAHTAETREVAACIRCQRVKKRCRMGIGPNHPCLDCIDVNPLSLRIPCIRSRVTDAILFRTSNTEKDTWTVRPEVFRLSDLATYLPSPLKRLELTHDLGNVLSVWVKEFTPVEGDQTSYTHKLKDGTLLVTEVPPYAIAQLEDTKAALNDYVDRSLQAYLEDHFDDSDFLVWETFHLAIKRACWQDSKLLQKSLRLWMASRLTERPWRICGEETLGMTVIDDPRSPLRGRIPIPPVMDTQLDQVVIQSILVPLRHEVLKLLNERISKKSRKDWFEIYATIFVLLNSVEIATAHDHDFAQRYGHFTPGRGYRFEDYNLIEGYFHSAQALIAHFRDALHGQKPFGLDWTSSDLTSLAEVNTEEARYLQMLGHHLSKKKTTYSSLKEQHRYESMLYWGHQLFSDHWDPSQVQIKEIEA